MEKMHRSLLLLSPFVKAPPGHSSKFRINKFKLIQPNSNPATKHPDEKGGGEQQTKEVAFALLSSQPEAPGSILGGPKNFINNTKSVENLIMLYEPSSTGRKKLVVLQKHVKEK